MSEQSLYERLGGTYGIAGAVDILVDRLFADVLVDTDATVHERHGNAANVPGYKFLVTAWSIEATGGPKRHPGQDKTEADDTLSIGAADFDAMAFEIAATLSFVGVRPVEHREFMQIIESYRPQVVIAQTLVH